MQPVQPTRNNLLTNYGGSCAKAGAAVALVVQGSKDASAAYRVWNEFRTPAPDESRLPRVETRLPPVERRFTPIESGPVPVQGSPVQGLDKLDDGAASTRVVAGRRDIDLVDDYDDSNVDPVDHAGVRVDHSHVPVDHSHVPVDESSRRPVSHAPNQTLKKAAILAGRAGVSFGIAGYLALSALRGCVVKKA